MEGKYHNLFWIETTDRRRNPHTYLRDLGHDYAEAVRNQPAPRNIKGE